jgi:hypothetical protein
MLGDMNMKPALTLEALEKAIRENRQRNAREMVFLIGGRPRQAEPQATPTKAAAVSSEVISKTA